MKNMSLVLLSMILCLSSCMENAPTQKINTDIISNPGMTGDTVNQLASDIMVIFHDKQDNYWFGSWKNGLYRYNGSTLLHYTTKNGLPHQRIEEIKDDVNGNVYINTSHGILKYNGMYFTTLNVALSDTTWNLGPNDLWFKDGWNSGYVYRYDGETLTKLLLPKSEIGEEYNKKYPDLNSYTVYTIYKDHEGNVWFGTSLLGAFRYNGKNFDWISEEDVTELHDGPANGVRSIIEDEEGYFWFNSNYRYKIREKKISEGDLFYERVKSIGNLDGKEDSNLNEYLSITKDKKGDLWIATYTNGVWRYDGSTVKHYPIQENGKEIKLFYIYTDSHGIIWLGTHENGVWRQSGETFVRFKP